MQNKWFGKREPHEVRRIYQPECIERGKLSFREEKKMKYKTKENKVGQR